MTAALSSRSTRSVPSPIYISSEETTFLNQIPDLLAYLDRAQVYFPYRNVKILDAHRTSLTITSGQRIPILSLVQPLKQFFIFSASQIPSLKMDITLQHRSQIYGLTSRMETLCQDYDIQDKLDSINLMLSRFTQNLSQFSESQFETLRTHSFFLKHQTIEDYWTSKRTPPIRITYKFSDNPSVPIKIYLLSLYALTHIAKEQEGSRDIREGRWNLAVRASSPTLAIFPRELLSAISRFLLYWNEKPEN